MWTIIAIPLRPRVNALLGAVLAASLLATGASPALADPPPWAPAHGYRAKKHGHAPSATAVYFVPFDLDLGRCNRQALGGVLGGVAGGVAGSGIGKGDGRTAAIIGGTLLGVLIGGSIGRSMDVVDQHCVAQTLEHAPDGQTIAWSGPRANTRYEVTPRQTYQVADGRYCREYVTEAEIGGRSQQVYGTACRQPDGAWQLAN
ncbi:MAG: hypothetical protein HY521_01170 [Proteobacteria bacterium]|nr:hypothetical protein [Pseudomonadota bacterium]